MPYDPSIERGNASYRSVLQLTPEIVATLVEGGNDIPWCDKRYAELVYDVSEAATTVATTSAIYATMGNTSATINNLTYGTPSSSINVSNNIYHVFEIIESPTSGVATVKLEGSIDNSTFFNLDVLNRQHILSGDSTGIYALSYTGKIPFARINYLTGDSVLTVKYSGGR